MKQATRRNTLSAPWVLVGLCGEAATAADSWHLRECSESTAVLAAARGLGVREGVLRVRMPWGASTWRVAHGEARRVHRHDPRHAIACPAIDAPTAVFRWLEPARGEELT